MWSRSKDGNDRIRRQTTKLSCQTTVAMNNDHDGQCQSAFDTSNSHLVTLDFFYKKCKSQCANVEQKQRWKRWNQTTSDKIIMSDDDSDEKRSRRTMPISICTCGTLILVPHSHIDFLQKCKSQRANVEQKQRWKR